MNKQYKENFLHAGKLAREVRLYGKSLIQPGASYNDVIAKINQKIESLGAIPAFPPQIALDNIAAHFLPMPGEDIVFNNQVAKLDIGVCYKGAIGDCAVTIDLSGKHQKLIDAAEASLLAAEQSIKVGVSLGEIGRTIESTALSYGFNPVRNLSGHGLGIYKTHVPPTIPNYDNRSTTLIRPGMTFAVEPFTTTGAGEIYDAGNPTIFKIAAAGSVRSEIARKLLKKIKTFEGLPFAIHDLLDNETPLSDVQVGLNDLFKAKVIVGYAPLLEKTRGIVAQAENSILVDERGEVFVTTR